MTTTAYHGELAPASHTRKKSEMWSALAQLNTEEEFWPTVVSRIADGEFISTIAGEIKVNHSILRNWIRGDVEREKQYQEAEKAGRFARIQRVMQKTYTTATAEIEGAPTTMEQLRAAEILLKHEQPEERTPTHVANIAITFVQAKDGREVKEKVIDPVS